MYKRVLQELLLAFLFSCYTCSSQSLGSYSLPETFNQVYNFKPNEAYDYLKKAGGKTGPDPTFIDQIYNTQGLFDNNHTYLEWYEMELYLHKILDTLMPAYVKRKQPMRAFVTRNFGYEINAVNSHFVFISAGLLNQYKDEGKLAYGLAIAFGKYLYYDYRKPESFAKVDSFVQHCLVKGGYNVEYAQQAYEAFEMRDKIYRNTSTFAKLEQENGVKNSPSQKKGTPGVNRFQKLIALKEAQAKKQKDPTVSSIKKYVVDSIFFLSMSKPLREECKKLSFEYNYDECTQLCFIDYLRNPKSPKNLYYLIESLRRSMYTAPSDAKKGFLFRNFEDYYFYDYGHSILEYSDFLFDDLDEYIELKNHPLIIGELKAFETNEQALVYFCNEALKYNIQEANLTLALYYYSILDKENFNRYITAYLANENAANYEYAKMLKDNYRIKLNGTKKLILYNNTENYSGTFGFRGRHQFNYYNTINKMKDNKDVGPLLIDDTSKTNLVFINELYGSKPALLWKYQKLINCITKMYDETDIEIFKKKRLNARETMDEIDLKRRNNKNLLVLAPEWYNWMNENNYKVLFYVDIIYAYGKLLETNEYYNTFTGYYLDMNESRPYFKDAVRIGNHRTETNIEILKDLNNFLYGKE